MATTVAAIADAAFDAVAAKITGVINACTVTRVTNGAYNTSTGTYATTTSNDTGRALVDETKPIADLFPDYVVGPSDTLILCEGLSTAPQENDTITIGATTRTITKVRDIVGAGTLFYVVAR